MVQYREGEEKISSPHSVNYFGDQNPPKMWSCDLYWIIVLFVIHLKAFRVENFELSACVTFSIGGTDFGETWSETF